MNKNILILAAHPSDEILSMGGTLAKHIAEKDNVYVCVATEFTPDFLENGISQKVHAESLLVRDFLKIKDYFHLKLPYNRLDTIPQYKINNAIAEVIKKTHPNLVYTCDRKDIDVDHKQIFQSTLLASSTKGSGQIQAIYSYETISENKWNFSDFANYFRPNYFVDISRYLETKTNTMEIYASQKMGAFSTRDKSTIKSLARLRGSAINVEYAEAFTLIKEISF